MSPSQPPIGSWPAVLADSNARFGKPPHTDQNRPRPLAERDTLAEICAWREDRPVSNRLTLPYDTVRYDTVLFLLEPTEITRGLRRTRVTVADDPEGRLAIF